MKVNIVTLYKGEAVSAIKFTDRFNLHEALSADTAPFVVEVTGNAWLPSPGATWTDSGFIQGDLLEPVINPSTLADNVASFAIVVGNRCLFRTDISETAEDNRIEAYRNGATIEVTWINEVDQPREVRPWDFLNPKTEYVDDETASNRLDICKKCPHLLKMTNQCKKCGCFMNLKTKLKEASCPIGHW